MGARPEESIVLLTGFGPFGGHEVNASWKAVQELERRGMSDNIKLHTVEVPVEYKFVTEELPRIEKQLKPKLIVHVGVSGVTEVVQIETCAHKIGYDREDISGCTPCEEEQCKQECLKTSLDVSKMIKFCEKHKCCCKIEPSSNAGRYLCEFIYYTSLCCKIAPSLFVHVPCLNEPYPKEELAKALELVILAALSQMDKEM